MLLGLLVFAKSQVLVEQKTKGFRAVQLKCKTIFDICVLAFKMFIEFEAVADICDAL